eukprot:4974141-Amphidinium_carterae.2
MPFATLRSKVALSLLAKEGARTRKSSMERSRIECITLFSALPSHIVSTDVGSGNGLLEWNNSYKTSERRLFHKQRVGCYKPARKRHVDVFCLLHVCSLLLANIGTSF